MDGKGKSIAKKGSGESSEIKRLASATVADDARPVNGAADDVARGQEPPSGPPPELLVLNFPEFLAVLNF